MKTEENIYKGPETSKTRYFVGIACHWVWLEHDVLMKDKWMLNVRSLILCCRIWRVTEGFQAGGSCDLWFFFFQ